MPLGSLWMCALMTLPLSIVTGVWVMMSCCIGFGFRGLKNAR
jgi:hypothetical protein